MIVVVIAVVTAFSGDCVPLIFFSLLTGVSDTIANANDTWNWALLREHLELPSRHSVVSMGSILCSSIFTVDHVFCMPVLLRYMNSQPTNVPNHCHLKIHIAENIWLPFKQLYEYQDSITVMIYTCKYRHSEHSGWRCCVQTGCKRCSYICIHTQKAVILLARKYHCSRRWAIN